MRRRRTIAAYHLAVAAFAGFVGGVIVTGVVVQDRSSARRDPGAEAFVERQPPAAPDRAAPVKDTVEPAVLTSRSPEPGFSIDPVADLRDRDLLVPVQGVPPGDLRSSFEERRGGGDRRHEAMDILAPRNTPVIAVEGGTIARLFSSDRGGITVYQFDPMSRYVYYYAHLERYAAGLQEGGTIKPGQVIGYVGTSGNAPPGTPHLHFAIFKLTEQKRWWEGTPIDPYLVLR